MELVSRRDRRENGTRECRNPDQQRPCRSRFCFSLLWVVLCNHDACAQHSRMSVYCAGYKYFNLDGENESHLYTPSCQHALVQPYLHISATLTKRLWLSLHHMASAACLACLVCRWVEQKDSRCRGAHGGQYHPLSIRHSSPCQLAAWQRQEPHLHLLRLLPHSGGFQPCVVPMLQYSPRNQSLHLHCA